ncbi:MAG: ABC transporter permease [Pedobacter sp.]|nr:ABC transporter permease [Pedobacter sp.]MDQ8053125.1 ABC transporter permease [Pedobacter sp.]
MRSLYLSFFSEFYKSRKTLAFWAAIILPVVICGLVAFGFYDSSQRILKLNYSPMMYWYRLSSNTTNIMGMMILPFYVIFMTYSVNNIEHKNDTWKTIFTLPLNKLSIYSAKYLYTLSLVIICLGLFCTLTYASGFLLQFLESRFKFDQYSPIDMLSKGYLKLFLSVLGIVSIQFIISLIWSDFLKPMGIGFIGVILGIIVAVAGWKYAKFFPYSQPMITLNTGKRSNEIMTADFTLFTTEVIASIITAIGLFIVGYYIVAKKTIK